MKETLLSISRLSLLFLDEIASKSRIDISEVIEAKLSRPIEK
ncbi:hypothetical protein [Sporosalibacterium faouarense]|nr:hypothetical protein [Sporosalibacterium faouarense]